MAEAKEVDGRRREFLQWASEVRDPAMQTSEGERTVITDSAGAIAAYDIAQLPSGLWAVTVHCQYRCGDCSGLGVPWTTRASRDECLQFFLQVVRRHFRKSRTLHDAPRQAQAQRDMELLLNGHGLFGFIEPEPSAGCRSHQTLFSSEGEDDGDVEAATCP